MPLILFTSEAYIKAYTPIGDNVDWSEIKSSAELTQDSYIQDILGTNFYNYIQTKYAAQTLTTDEQTLMNYIKPALAYRIAEQSLPWISYQVKNKGVMQQRGDYADATDLTGIKYLRNELSNRAEFYATRLTNYLGEFGSLFPDYITNNSTDMPPNPGSYDNCDLWLGDDCSC